MAHCGMGVEGIRSGRTGAQSDGGGFKSLAVPVSFWLGGLSLFLGREAESAFGGSSCVSFEGQAEIFDREGVCIPNRILFIAGVHILPLLVPLVVQISVDSASNQFPHRESNIWGICNGDILEGFKEGLIPVVGFWRGFHLEV